MLCITIGDAEGQPLNAIPLEVLGKTPELEILMGFEKQAEIIRRLVAKELIDIRRVSTFELETDSRSEVWTELAREAVIVEIGNPAVDTEGDFVSPKQAIAAVTISDPFRVEAVIVSVVELIDSEEFHALPLNEARGVPKTCTGIVSDSSEGIAHP